MPAFSLLHMNELWLFGLMGVLMGAVAIGLIRALAWLENLFERLPVAAAADLGASCGRVSMGAIGCYFYPQVLGTSYGTIGAVLDDLSRRRSLIGISWPGRALVSFVWLGYNRRRVRSFAGNQRGIGAVYGMLYDKFSRVLS